MTTEEEEGNPHFFPSVGAHRAWPMPEVSYSAQQAGSRLVRGEVAVQCRCLRRASSGEQEGEHKAMSD